MVYSLKCWRSLKILLTATIIFICRNIYTDVRIRTYFQVKINVDKNSHGKWRNLSQEQVRNLSNLGRILFLDEVPQPIETRLNPYKILWWNFQPDLAVRHIRNKSNPLQGCSVMNCEITHKHEDLEKVDLVVFYLHRTHSIRQIPARTGGSSQIWTFLTDESPYHTLSRPINNFIKHYNNIFNWSMTYRMTSDIPVPYGRAVALKRKGPKINIDEWNNSKKQNVLVSIAVSNCISKRMQYVKKLSNYIQIDIYGLCGNLTCPGHYELDCRNISAYKFHLAFENSNCEEYITEKVWWNGYHNNVIPVIFGSTKLSLQQSLPPHSYIDVNDFASPKDLANYLLHLNNSLDELESFFEWKRDFTFFNEHGFFSSPSLYYCRMCEALNYNNKRTKIYHNLEDFIGLQLCQ